MSALRVSFLLSRTHRIQRKPIELVELILRRHASLDLSMLQPAHALSQTLDKHFTNVSKGQPPSSKYEPARIAGLDDDKANFGKSHFGINLLNIDAPEFWPLFIERATAPFFVFQVGRNGLLSIERYGRRATALLLSFSSHLPLRPLRSQSQSCFREVFD